MTKIVRYEADIHTSDASRINLRAWTDDSDGYWGIAEIDQRDVWHAGEAETSLIFSREGAAALHKALGEALQGAHR